MRLRQTLILAAALAMAAPSLCIAAPPEQTLVVAESGGSYRLSVPISQLVMTMPRGGLAATQYPASASPRYFQFEDASRGVMLSGWFEPAGSFRGIDAFWKSETGEWQKRGMPEPLNVSMAKIGQWDAIAYDIAVPQISNTHIRAHWVQANTWIDVHVSVTSREPVEAARRRAMEVLNGIVVSAAQ
jgi:hypothetical protein